LPHVESEFRVVCASCGTENEAGRTFCKECAARLELVCPSCEAANSADAKFCGECAAPLVAAAAPAGSATSRPGLLTTSAAPATERRLVSLLFADLVGFTTLAEGRDAEDTRELLSRYFDLARDVIGRYGGTVEKFIGDAVMAVWGAPVAHEDDAERAVRAGLELVDAVRSLGPAIAARAGVLTGEAAVTIGAVGQGMVAGDLVNTASRLQSAAAPGTVLVGEATQRASAKAIAFQPAGDRRLKGRSAPVTAWRALRVVAERGGRNRSEALEAPFVGRDDELRLLTDLYHATGRERRARLVSITGIGGIGKTRLAWELGKRLDGLVEPIWWHEGRSPAYGDGITFWALGEMVRRRAGLVETDDERTTRAKVAETVAEHVPDAAERRWIEPALLALLGIDTDAVDSGQLFAAWRTFFERLTATGTVVMVFEDLQWADPGLLDFIDALLEWSRSFPIFVLTLARPELFEKLPAWGAGKRSFSSIFLEPLPAAVMRELLAGLVPGFPDAAVTAVVERADGVPLYAVETVRMLLAEGKLTLDGDVYRPIPDLATMAVPETLTELVAARLDALEAPERTLLLDAAVLGQSFTRDALAAVSGIAQPELEPRLISLVRHEFLTLQSDPRSPERGQYAFVQALIREVAYNTLAKRDRKVRHLAAARYFEALGTDELAGALARHYLAAHRNAPRGAEADAVAAQARIALRAAAERAAGLGSHAQAVAFLEQALSVTTDPAGQATLLELAGHLASLAADHEAAERFLVKATDIYRGLGDRSAAARTIAELGRALLRGLRHGRALAMLEPAATEFADLVGDPGAVALDSQLARALMVGLQHQRGVEVADRALAAAERGDLVALVADTLVTRGSALCNLGRSYEGVGAIRTGIDLAQANGLTEISLTGLSNLSFYLMDSDVRGVFDAARTALTLAARLGDRAGAVILVNATQASVDAGAWDWALGECTAATETAPGDVERAHLTYCRLMIGSLRGEDAAGEASWLEGFFGASDAEMLRESIPELRFWVAFGAGRLSDAHEAAMEYGHIMPAEASYIFFYAAICALWERDGERAAAALAALDATGVHGRVVDMNRRTIRAGLAALEGRPGEALSSFREALAGWRDLGSPWREALTGITMATLLEPTAPEVRAAAEAAREILVRLEAAPFIARLDAAMARSPDRTGGPAAPQEVSVTPL
jgi:class 3 adenylate cyclase/tetratricopeptide (TPR) repeat protein